MKMANIKRTMLMVGVPAVLVAGGLTSIAASAATRAATPSQKSQPQADPLRVRGRTGREHG